MSGQNLTLANKRPLWVHILLFIFGPFLFGFLVGYLLRIFALLVGLDDASVTLLQIVTIFAINATACSMVGYRWFDAFAFYIPFYNLYISCKVWWRVCSLPYKYWEGDTSQSEVRNKVMKDAMRRGASKGLAEMTAYALFPLDGRSRPSPRFATDVQNMIIETTSAIRSISNNAQLEGIVVDSLQSYAMLAADCGEDFYVRQFTSLLTRNGHAPGAVSSTSFIPGPAEAQWGVAQPSWAHAQSETAQQFPAPSPTPAAVQPAWQQQPPPASTFPTLPAIPPTQPAPPTAPPTDDRPAWMPPSH